MTMCRHWQYKQIFRFHFYSIFYNTKKHVLATLTWNISPETHVLEKIRRNLNNNKSSFLLLVMTQSPC